MIKFYLLNLLLQTTHGYLGCFYDASQVKQNGFCDWYAMSPGRCGRYCLDKNKKYFSTWSYHCKSIDIRIIVLGCACGDSSYGSSDNGWFRGSYRVSDGYCSLYCRGEPRHACGSLIGGYSRIYRTGWDIPLDTRTGDSYPASYWSYLTSQNIPYAAYPNGYQQSVMRPPASSAHFDPRLYFG